MSVAPVSSGVTGVLFEMELLMKRFSMSLVDEGSMSALAERHIYCLPHSAFDTVAFRLETSKSGEPTPVILNSIVFGDRLLVPVF